MTRGMYMAVVFLMATSVGQANQHSGAGGCPSDINPNNVASFLETKPQMGVLMDGGEDRRCSSVGECPSGNKPQYVVSLLQKKLQMNVLEGGGEDSIAELKATEAPFALGAQGSADCPDGHTTISENQGCESAAHALGFDWFTWPLGSWTNNMPYGCSLDVSSGNVHNNPQSGGVTSGIRRICVASTTEAPTTAAP